MENSIITLTRTAINALTPEQRKLLRVPFPHDDVLHVFVREYVELRREMKHGAATTQVVNKSGTVNSGIIRKLLGKCKDSIPAEASA